MVRVVGHSFLVLKVGGDVCVYPAPAIPSLLYHDHVMYQEVSYCKHSFIIYMPCTPHVQLLELLPGDAWQLVVAHSVRTSPSRNSTTMNAMTRFGHLAAALVLFLDVVGGVRS